MTGSIFSLAGLLYSGINQVANKLNNAAAEAQQAAATQTNNYGGAVIMDLSPAAQASLKAGQSAAAAPITNPSTSVSASLFSGMAQSYSGGNTGQLDTNNSFFDQLFGNHASGASQKPGTGPDASTGNDSTQSKFSFLV